MQENEFQRYVREAFREMDHGVKHPSMQQIVEMADGSAPADAEVEGHLSTCEHCSQRLREFETFAADCERPVSREARDRINNQWPGLRRRIWRYKGGAIVPKWGSIAAGIVLAPGLVWLIMEMLAPSPARLLAEAYHEQRTSVFRIVDSRYSPFRIERGSGSASSKPAQLFKAQGELAERIKARPDDPELLRLQAEASMMERLPGPAVQTLLKALDFQPQDARILADLGVAYALRGELETQPADYPNALEYLSRSIRLQRAPEVIFNRALVLERMYLKDQAVLEWEAYLKLDGSSDWAKEAQKHLADLKAEMKSREDALARIVDDPDKFLALAATGSADAEAFLRDIAVTKWLPRVHSDPRAREATVRLGQILQQKHGDSWLAEMARDIDRSGMAEGLQRLADARVGNQTARAQEALASAREAQQSFARAGSQSGVLWARFEEVTAVRILLRSKECLPAADALVRDLDLHPYIWLRVWSRLEYQTCAVRSGRLGEATPRMREAMEISRLAGFGDAAIRADIGNLETISYIGLPSEIFQRAGESLRIFWSGAYPPVRFGQLVSTLGDVASGSGQRHVALFLARSGVWAISTSDPRREAGERARLAATAQAVGEKSESRANLGIADGLYAGLPVQFRTEPQAALAKVELDRGDVNAVLTRLEKLRASLDPPPAATVTARYYSVLGEAYRRKGLLPEAIDAFRKGINGRGVESLASERERAGVLKTIENSYRGLVAATLASSKDPAEGLRIWQSFRALDAVGISGHIEMGQVPVLSYVELPDGITAWLSRKNQVTLHPLSVSKAEVVKTVTRFRRECSDPMIDDRSLRTDAQQLHQWMVDPFAAQFTDTDRDLIFELDGVLAGVPVQALISPDGRYLGDRFSVMVSSGYAGARKTPPPDITHVLVVANPTLSTTAAARFPSLPDSLKEAETIRANFPGTTILKERDATVASLAASLPNAEIFHFAGHGYSDSDNGALLFAPRDPKISDYELLRSADLLRQDWSRCRLVVLSACAAAAGEVQGPHNPDSLVRAFTRAGVPRVAASLWNVDSAATAQLMATFYDSLARGASPTDALRAAQQKLRQHAGWSHPYYWAGFQLFGTT
jgi:CHAT domain-containing protein/tetratricopeptide (TPR) repeat protein